MTAAPTDLDCGCALGLAAGGGEEGGAIALLHGELDDSSSGEPGKRHGQADSRAPRGPLDGRKPGKKEDLCSNDGGPGSTMVSCKSIALRRFEKSIGPRYAPLTKISYNPTNGQNL